MNMNRRFFSSAGLAACAMLLAACGPEAATGPAPLTKAELAKEPLSLAMLAKHAKGFDAGSKASARTVYVFYDMQCLHCGRLWEVSRPLQSQLHFVWVPVGFLGPASVAQGATILEAADPVALMDQQKASMSSGGRGITADSGARDRNAAAVKTNSDLLLAIGGDSVPFLVMQDPDTGEIAKRPGAMSLPELRAWLKVR